MNKDQMKGLLKNAIEARTNEKEDIRSKIVIRKEFKELISALDPLELIQLEENILKEGVRDPLILWPVDNEYVLIDGHNRFAICQKHGIDFPFKAISFQDKDEVEVWMVNNQMGRRNLTESQKSYYRGLHYNREKKQGRRVDLTLDHSDTKSDPTADRIAKEYNVSPMTIKRDGQYSEGIKLIEQENPKLKNEILLETSPIKRKQVQAIAKKKKSKGRKVFHVDQMKPSATKMTPKSIAEIAFSFINHELRPISEVCNALNLAEPIEPVAFFIAWQVARSSK